jgi:hypothetical protein
MPGGGRMSDIGAYSTTEKLEPIATAQPSVAANGKGAARPKARKRDPNETRPVIRLAAGQIERIVDQSEVALIAADRGLYQRGKPGGCIGGIWRRVPRRSRGVRGQGRHRGGD